MVANYIKNIFLKHRKSRIRKLIRNYREFKAAKGSSVFFKVRKNLATVKLEKNSYSKYQSLFLGGYFPNELMIRQLLNRRINSQKIQKELLLSPQKIAFPMPLEWIGILEKEEFVVSRLRSSFLWTLYVLALGGFAIIISLGEIYSSFQARNTPRGKKFTQFIQLQRSSIPTNTGQETTTLVGWYASWKGRPNSVEVLRHSAYLHPRKKFGQIYIEGAQKELPNVSIIKALYLFLWTVTAFFTGACELFFGKWWLLFSLHEIVVAKKMQLVCSSQLAEQYLFSHDHCSYRPAWTYIVENRGSDCCVYFYSTNSVSIKSESGEREFYRAFSYMNWSKYLVWTPEHKEQLLKFSKENTFVKDEKFIVIGAPIPLSDNNRPLPVFKKNTITIFDVTPTRLSFYAELCFHVDYYTPRNSKKFLRDIESLRQQLGFNVALKAKRENKSIHDLSYIRLLASLEESGWLILDPTTSPNRIINGSKASIHFPFTSTGVIASELKKKSVYYDPSGNIASNDEASLGPAIVNSRASLRSFIVSVLSENQSN